MRMHLRLLVVFAVLLGASCAKPYRFDEPDPRYAKPEEVWNQLPGKWAWVRLAAATWDDSFIPTADYRISGQSFKSNLREFVLPKAGDRITTMAPLQLVVVDFETHRDQKLLVYPSLEFVEVPHKDRVALLMPETNLLVQIVRTEKPEVRMNIRSIWALVSPGG